MTKFEMADLLERAMRWMQNPVCDIVARPNGITAVISMLPEHPKFDDEDPSDFTVSWDDALGLGPTWNFASDGDREDSAAYLKLAETFEALSVKLRHRASNPVEKFFRQP